MRVITGKARGRKLSAVPGNVTRPTSDRIKESIFNIIQFDIEGRTVLDLFAGTGQLGIEALSRGAKEVVFTDMSAAAVNTIKSNLKSSGLTEGFGVYGTEALSFVSETAQKFDLIFLDPPYESVLLEKSILKIIEFDILKESGIIVCECDKKTKMPQIEQPYTLGKEYIYGGRKIQIINRENNEPNRGEK